MTEAALKENMAHWPKNRMVRVAILFTGAALAVALAGCTGVPVTQEKAARSDLKAVTGIYRPAGKAALPQLTTNSSLGEFMTFAMLNQSRVAAAYFDWASSVEQITVARSLPDPRLTFQSDIADAVQTVMPGLMMDFPGPGKLKAAAGVAAAESQGKYAVFEASVLEAALELKRAYYDLYFLDARVRVDRQTIGLLADLEKLARSQNEVGKVTMQDVLRAQIEQEQLATEIANLEDSRSALLARFKAALGLGADDAMPPFPREFESTPLDLTAEGLFAEALKRNPGLRQMEAEVRRADAALVVASKGKIPDFTIGLEADAKASPTLYRPEAAMTLPIWRDKIRAEIAGARADKHAAEARLSAGQIDLAVDFAEKTFMFRESTRDLELLQQKLVPKASLALEVARAAYLSSQLDFLNLITAERALLDFEMAEVDARVQRELTLAELSLLILGQPPQNAPILRANR